eukprot:2491654-Amphidinium_carterae.1
MLCEVVTPTTTALDAVLLCEEGVQAQMRRALQTKTFWQSQERKTREVCVGMQTFLPEVTKALTEIPNLSVKHMAKKIVKRFPVWQDALPAGPIGQQQHIKQKWFLF